MARKANARMLVVGVVSITILLFNVSWALADDDPRPRLRGTFNFRMTSVKSFSADDPVVSGVAAAPRQDILRVGVFKADGKGNLKGRTIATTDTNTGGTWIVKFDWTGKYVVNPDGTGYLSMDPVAGTLVCTNMTVAHTGSEPHPVAAGGTPSEGNVACSGGEEGHEDYAFVFSWTNIDLIQTDNDGGGAKIFMTGAAKRQW